ncbi:oligoendopeptidase F [Paucilactobacillus nenjiangensis]|uniref:Oligopeptidase F n=1 Tax=Paucilactobacillus nenjiangensis TaxID=1296540 RepID=A0A5P1WYQ3_9LACO|nr:oligoendopeptidase F [Paucilactobacillus nenjiangensis]QER66706.1 oligoendopeptidase F [Paucilactobacillus nenjiangensis]
MAEEKLLSRAEVPENLKWNLALLYQSDADMKADFEQTTKLVDQFAEFQGTLATTAANLAKALILSKQIDEELEKEFVYAFLRRDSDTTDATATELYGMISSQMSSISAKMAFFEPEIVEMDDTTIDGFFAAEPKLAEFKFMLTKIRNEKAHVLSNLEEQLLSRASKALNAPDEIYNTLNDADLTFGTVHDDDGNEVQLTHGNRSQFTESQNREVRKEAVLAYEKPYNELRNTFAQTLNSYMGMHNMTADVRHYSSARQASLSSNQIDEQVYDTLVSSVNQHLDLAHRWYALKKKVLGLDKFYKYDINVPIAGNDLLKTTFDEGKQLTREALSVLGPKYMEGLNREFYNRWIDAAENKGKRSGGYQISVYKANPFILLNWTDKLYSTYVLAHESGHAMHSYFSQAAQPSEYFEAPIFLAEVASTFNENILTNYLLEKYQDDKQIKIFILEQYINGFIGTIYRQSQFAEFEHNAYQTQEKVGTLTADYLDQMSGDLVDKYYGPSVTPTGTKTQSWAYVPHFYMNYYVYQYATSMAASTALSAQVWNKEDGALQRYYDFLSAGGSDYPVETLKRAGVDTTNSDYLEQAFKVFEQRLDEIETLLA